MGQKSSKNFTWKALVGPEFEGGSHAALWKEHSRHRLLFGWSRVNE